MPNAQPNPRSNATVQTSHAVVGVDVLERLSHCQVLWSIWILRLALHLNPNDLDRLIPSAETTAQTAGQDLLEVAQFLTVFLARHPTDACLRKPRQTEATTPICRLPNRNGVHATVDTTDSLLPVDVHEGGERARWLPTLSGDLVLCNLYRLHACTESHSGIRLRYTTGHASRDSCHEVIGAERLGIELGFRGDEEQDGSLCRGFDPGPRNQALIIWIDRMVRMWSWRTKVWDWKSTHIP